MKKQSKSIKIILFLMIYLFLINNIYAKNDKLVFNKYFTLVDSINLNIDDLLIGQIRRILVLGETDKIVINDMYKSKIFLIDSKKQKYKEIKIEKIMPGYKISVSGFYKDRDNGFSVSMPPFFYFKYDNDGNIVEQFKIQDKYIAHGFSFIEEPYFVFLSADPENKTYTLNRYNYKTGKLKQLTEVIYTYEDFNVLNRIRDDECFLTDDDGNVFIANSIENKIYKYDKNGKFLMEIISKNKRYKQFPVINGEGYSNVIKTLVSRKYDLFEKMHFLNPKTIIAAYLINEKGKGRTNIELFDKDSGESLWGEAIVAPLSFLYAVNNYIYLLKEVKKEDENGNISNPTILKYRYNSIKN